MYNKVECIVITCDNCKETYTDEHSGFSIYVDENGANEAADSDGWHNDSKEHYCPSCHTIDENDNLIINKERYVEPKIFSRKECVFHYCPSPDLCKERCVSGY